MTTRKIPKLPHIIAGLPADAYDYAARDVRVIDGDTIAITLARAVDFGFGITAVLQQADQKLRLAGLDAKPIKTPNGVRAAGWLIQRVADSGGTLHVVTVKNRLGRDDHEKYGRYLAFLFATQGDVTVQPSLNEQMIAAGLALPWDGKGPHPGPLTTSPAPPPNKH